MAETEFQMGDIVELTGLIVFLGVLNRSTSRRNIIEMERNGRHYRRTGRKLDPVRETYIQANAKMIKSYLPRSEGSH